MSDEPEHPPSFQFYPRDFLASTSVNAMPPEALGGYITLMCHAWNQPECGVLPDDETLLAALSKLGERWPAHRSAIRRAFAERTREGKPVLVQLRLVKEREAQRKRYKQASEGARITNEKRWPSVALRPDSESHSGRSSVTPASASASASASESTSTAEKPRARKRRAPAPQLTIEQLAEKFGLTVAKVRSNAAKISASGRYTNEYRTLLNWCATDAAEGNGKLVNGNGADGYTKCRTCGHDLEQAESIRLGYCGSCRSEQRASM